MNLTFWILLISRSNVVYRYFVPPTYQLLLVEISLNYGKQRTTTNYNVMYCHGESLRLHLKVQLLWKTGDKGPRQTGNRINVYRTRGLFMYYRGKDANLKDHQKLDCGERRLQVSYDGICKQGSILANRQVL